jgi:hypothetical protein
MSKSRLPDDTVMSRRRRGSVRTVRCTTCSSHRHIRGRLHVRTHPPRIRCRMTASVHICTAHHRTPGGEAFAAGHRSRDICSCRSVFDWAATCNPLNRAFPDRTPYRSPCRAESHRAPTTKDSRARNPRSLGKPSPIEVQGQFAARSTTKNTAMNHRQQPNTVHRPIRSVVLSSPERSNDDERSTLPYCRRSSR